MTPTGTNLLGVVKHLIGIEAGYLGASLHRPFPGHLPWIEAESGHPNVARVLKDTAMHAGQLQILRELIDGRSGSDRADLGDERWWADYVARLTVVAEHFQPRPDSA